MARVPTWTELRMDASRLVQLQRECYYSVHKLLDSDIPELDRKISSLNGSSNGCLHEPDLPTRSLDVVPPISIDGPYVDHLNRVKKPETLPIRSSKSLESVQFRNFNYPEVALIRDYRIPETSPDISHKIKSSNNHKTQQVVHDELITSPEFVTAPNPNVNQNRAKDQRKNPTRTRKAPEIIHHEYEPNIDELEHLQPLPLPLSYYFQKNRPGLVMRVNSRVMYLRNKSERRKQLASSRIINSLERIRLSSRNSVNFPSRQNRKDFMVPKYQIQCRLSEYEMKRLTAKTYKRLPEVKKRRREEFSNHMKVQNYKNRLEYGRKLLENRRHGIINYPLRSSCDDRSITSSQSDFF